VSLRQSRFSTDRGCITASLSEVVSVAKACYSDLANPELPEWNYRVRDFRDFVKAVEDYKSRIAETLGFEKNYRHKLGLTVLQTPVLSENESAHERLSSFPALSASQT
jgi:hypothetical protein